MAQNKKAPTMKIVCPPHAKKRMSQRGIKLPQIKDVLLSPVTTVRQANGKSKAIGEIVEGRALIVVYIQTGSRFVIITTYYA